MGLFNNDDATKEIEEKNAEIESLKRELQAAKTCIKERKDEKVVLHNKDSKDNGEESSKYVRQVSIKLPSFSELNPELWFARAESQFKTKSITSDSTKFHHLYALMTDKAANEIETLLLDPPKTGKVDTIRTKLVRRFGQIQYNKDLELLNTRSLGDLKPSQMWSKFQRLNKDPSDATSSFVKVYLMSMYPPEVRGVLANMSFKYNDEMAEAADRYLENAKKKPGDINEVRSEEVQEDEGQVDAISRGPKGRSQGRAGSDRPSAGGQPKTCFFNDCHGLEAFKCGGPPCPFASAPLAARSGNATASL